MENANAVAVPTPARDPRPFSRKPQRSFGYLLREAARRLDRSISRGLGAFGLTVSQYHLLRELWDVQGLTVRELALRVNIAEPSTLLTLSKMQKSGLIAIRTAETDRRKRCVFLEPAGAQLRAPVLTVIEQVSARAYAGVAREDLQSAARVFAAFEMNLSD